jgi:hypothetical protein
VLSGICGPSSQANAADEAWRARGTAAGGTCRMAPGSAKPYRSPQLPAGTINRTDPDSRLVKTFGQKAVRGYNAQVAVNEDQILVAAEVTVESRDFGHLEPMVAAAGASSRPSAQNRRGWSAPTPVTRTSAPDGGPRPPRHPAADPSDSGLRESACAGWDRASTRSCAACCQPTRARRSTANAIRRLSRCSDR